MNKLETGALVVTVLGAIVMVIGSIAATRGIEDRKRQMQLDIENIKKSVYGNLK